MLRTNLDQLAKFDDLIRCYSVLVDPNSDKEFLRYVKSMEDDRAASAKRSAECRRLQKELDESTRNLSVLENKLSTARKMMDDEKLSRKKVELEREVLADQLQQARNLLLNDPKYSSLCEKFLSVAEESGCTSSFLSESSFSMSEDNLDDSVSFFCSKSRNRKGRIVENTENYRAKNKRNNSSTAFADEDICTIKRKRIPNPPAITPSAPTESVDASTDSDHNSLEMEIDCANDNANVRTPIFQRINAQGHTFVALTKITSMMQNCTYCNRKAVARSRSLWKCKCCFAIAHAECVDKVPLPCVPLETPKKGGANTISSYVPNHPPMIPAIIIHCVNELENRGLKEVGLYKISGSEGGVRNLKEKFQKGKGAPNLSSENIHDLCSFLKNFLSSLQEPLIPHQEWATFARAVVGCEKKNRLYNAISLLPQPNRDTLSYMILHLQKVAESPDCKVSTLNLVAIFAPIIIGYSGSEHSTVSQDAQTARLILQELLSLPPDYWCSLICFHASAPTPLYTIRSTPSSESISKHHSHYLFTPGGKNKYFHTPPHK